MNQVSAAPSQVQEVPAKIVYGFPFWILVSYFFIEYVRPQDRLPVIGALKIGLLLTCLSALIWFMKGDKAVLREPLVRFFIAFILLAAATVPLAVNNYWAYRSTEVMLLCLLAAALPSTTILAEPARLFRFFKLWILFHVLITFSSIGTGGRGSGGFLIDENDFALAVVMAIPYAYFMSQSPRNKFWTRLLYLAAAGVLALGVIITASRGGFVGLVGCLAMILVLAKHKLRNLLLVCVVALGVWTFVPSSYYAEVESITDPTDSTRLDRIYMWERAMEMYADNPVMGVGAGNFPWRIFEYQLRTPDFDYASSRQRGGRVAHSLYFTLISELGTVGALLYAGMLWLILRKLFRVIKAKSDNPAVQPLLTDFSLLAKAMIVSLGAYLLSGAFLSVLYYPHLWYLIGFVIALSYCVAKLAPGSDTATAPHPP